MPIAVIRTLGSIIAAIQLSHPQVSPSDATRYAHALREQAELHDFDPFTGVVMIAHESHFRANAISPDGEDYGLAQIRARFIGACQANRSPKRNPSPDCAEQKRRLLEPEENIRIMAELISQHREFCQRKRHSAQLEHWLASYQGRNDARARRWCEPGPDTWKVVTARRRLIRQLYQRGMLDSPR
jgi:hypothetical protein